MCGEHVAMLTKVNHIQIVMLIIMCVFVDNNIVVNEQRQTKSKIVEEKLIKRQSASVMP